MIATVTFNPAIDKRYYVEGISIGEVQRVIESEDTAGGKGVNVSRVVALLGESVTATGFLGGTNGQFIANELRRLNISDRFLRINGQTRCCLAIIDKNYNQTEFLENGPRIGSRDYDKWLEIYDALLSETNIITASGSLPQGLPVGSYAEIITKANKKGVKLFLDSSGEALLQGIKALPYFIKPNTDELRFITKKEANTRADIIGAIRNLNNQGIKIVSVTLGRFGSITGCEGSIFEALLPEINSVNPVGSGDAFTAGMAVAAQRGMDIVDSIIFASACGTANAMEARTGFIRPENIDKISKNIKVNKINI
jgi:tagatose 6-phosphate kinase